MDVLKLMSQQIELVDEKLSPEHKAWKEDCINARASVAELIEAADQAWGFLSENVPASATEFRLRKALYKVKGVV